MREEIPSGIKTEFLGSKPIGYINCAAIGMPQPLEQSRVVFGEDQMLYIVLFEDSPSLGTDVRRQHMPAHLSFLEKNAARIKAAGPLRTTSGEPAGGLWVVEAESPDVVDALVKDDPFWPTGLRQSVRILNWAQVFADGRRLI